MPLLRHAGARREDQSGYAEMKKAKDLPVVVEESLAAIQSVVSSADLRQGLANTMSALLCGEISADDGLAIVKAAKRQRTMMNREVLK